MRENETGWRGDADAPTETRGQAYTLEGIIGGMVILVAILFTLNTIVVTPSSGGGLSADAQSDLRVQAEDALVTIAQNDSFDLSAMTRYWDQGNRSFVGGINQEVGYGSRTPPGNIGTILNETFVSRGHQYAMELSYLETENGTIATEQTGTIPVVHRGQPAGESVTATYRVTLYDNETLTSPSPTTSGVELWQIDANATDGDDGYYPIPNAADGPIYNVVEVRLTIW